MNAVDWVLIGAAAGIAVPVGVVTLEVLAALGWRRGCEGDGLSCATEAVDDLNGVAAEHAQRPFGSSAENERVGRAAEHGTRAEHGTPHRPRMAVLMPAHNEEGIIVDTLAAIMPQLEAGDRMLVVADNCTDATARLARAAGADVVERTHATDRGKGFALAAGIAELAADAPEMVIILDADTAPAPGCIAALAGARGPAQGLYVMDVPAGAGPKSRISALAFAFKNHVRALGADALGVPCLLRGTGMAFPWKLIAEQELASGNLVEDMQLGMDLALAGAAPRFCPEARVSGSLPGAVAASAVQRTRWEHGHLQTIVRNVPRLMWRGVTTARPSLIALALDLAVPPLALLCMLWCMLAVAAAVLWGIGLASAGPFVALMGVGALLAGSILAGWARFARHILPARALLAVPFYILWKIPLYFAFLWKRQQAWIRTERVS